MTDEQAKAMILRAIQNAGVEVVTDKQVMESVLGESLWNKTVAACIEKQVITFADLVSKRPFPRTKEATQVK